VSSQRKSQLQKQCQRNPLKLGAVIAGQRLQVWMQSRNSVASPFLHCTVSKR
jgi:hypothetical protein